MGKSLQGGRLVSNSRIFVDSGGNIGIGSTQPTSKLDITGDVKITGISTLSNVTVGGATTELVVNGDARVTGILTVGTASLTLNGTTGAITGGSLTNAQVAAISSEISDTAVDVFVYDTSKDSDGGAWRKRTQHTSWYNETLNTSTRGSRKEFPAVAVIVVETDTLTIYDGDDPDLPMWMVFETNTSDMLVGNGFNAVAMLNGIFSVVRNTPIIMVNFVADKSTNISPTSETNYIGNIEQRNDGLGYTSNIGDRRAATNGGNDVAMTVLPNAPIDDATGLPVPTIAVATPSGVSIIKDNGSAVDIKSTKAVNDVELVHFDKAGRLYFAAQSSSSVTDVYHYSRYTIPSVGILNNVYSDNSDATYYPRDTSGASFQNVRPNFNAQYNDGVNEDITHISSNDDGGIVGNVNGLSIFAEDYLAQGNGMVAYAATSYNTGWMHGDNKGAFLSDTDDTNVTGSELVTNGTFDSDVSGWTAVNATITYSSGTAVVNRTGGAGLVAYQTITTVVGEAYVLSGTVDSTGTGNRGDIRAYSDNGSTMLVNASGTDNQTVNISATFTATTTTTYIYFTIDSTGTATFDNVSVRILSELDRSVNNNGLQVFGTVTKSAVATGADLVGYSGFSNSNVLVQPYNSDLDPGTGNYMFMCWFKCSSTSAEQIIMRRFGNPTVTGGMMLRVVSSTSVLQWYVRGTDTVGYVVNTSQIVDDNVWHCAVGTREGGTAKLYLDGQLIGLESISTISHDPGSTAKLCIGAEEVTNSPGTFQNPASNTTISLVRYSLSIPTPDQVKKMYEDEKVLFQENAACTLYGSSDAVTALTYDESTNLLYAGTSSGRSDFQGLRRINNTTTAVTTAMSASNGLVAEQ